MQTQIIQERRQYWLEKVNAWKSSGQTAFAWCKENNISSKAFYRWRSYFKSNIKTNLKTNSFIELKNTKSCSLEIEYKKYKLHLKDFSFNEAESIFKILKAL